MLAANLRGSLRVSKTIVSSCSEPRKLAFARASLARMESPCFGISSSSGSNATFTSTSTSNDQLLPFKPRRRPSRNYRPVQPTGTPLKTQKRDSTLQNMPRGPDTMPPYVLDDDADDATWEDGFGPYAADALRDYKRSREIWGPEGQPDVEAQLRMADYVTAAAGSTEDLVGERRALAMGTWDEEDKIDFLKDLDAAVVEQRTKEMGLEDDDVLDEDGDEIKDEGLEEGEDPNQLAHGDWGETVAQIDRVQKVQRGGTTVRYRALVVGGNSNGCAGFGIGKAASPNEATLSASRMCRRNIFFVDRYQNRGLARDLVGKQNSCKVQLRATSHNRGLKGHPLISDILVYFGITDCSSKSFGNRNRFNVVRATFKAIATHESVEDMALKRGKRLIHVQQAEQLQI